MKKTLLAFMALGAMALTSCENLLQQITEAVLGNADITLTDDNGSEEMDLSSCLVNAVALENGAANTLMIAANVDLTEEDAVLSFPYMGISISDTTVGSYAMEPFTLAVVNDDDSFSAETLINKMRSHNLIVLMASDSNCYVSYGGTLTVTDYPQEGKVTGSIEGTMLHATAGDIRNVKSVLDTLRAELRAELRERYNPTEEELDDMVEEHLRQLPLNRLFPNEVSISAEFKGKRVNRNLADLIMVN